MGTAVRKFLTWMDRIDRMKRKPDVKSEISNFKFLN
jgi:hypothetical protein